eukprot:scaffold503_cov81-Cylindrotheca_fusiformis.AAC.4
MIVAPLHQSKQSQQQQQQDTAAVLTDLDARVLQEMLLDSQKLDLQETENMKSLLERGIKAKENPTTTTKEQEQQSKKSSSPFQSEALQALGSTKLWKVLERKAEDWIESAKLYVTNSVERNVQVLTGLGLFAFERAMQDVARALPATSSSSGKKRGPLLLSAYNETKVNQRMKKNLRQEMSTPMDEIQAVGREIKDILRQASDEERIKTRVQKNASPFGLKSTASSSNKIFSKERFQKAYQRKQETTLRQERENVLQSSARIANSVADKAYQIRQEVKTNIPGFKTETQRKRLAFGAKRLLGSAKQFVSTAKLAAASSKEREDLKLPENLNGGNSISSEPSQGTTTTTKPTPTTTISLAMLELQDVLETELEELIERFTECIQNPQETWLNSDLLLSCSQNGNDECFNFPDDELERVVVSMVQSQIIMQQQQNDEDETNPEALIATLKLVLSSIEEMCDICRQVGSLTIANYLQQRLLYGDGGKGDGVYAEQNTVPVPVLLNLDEYQTKWEQACIKDQQHQATATAATQRALHQTNTMDENNSNASNESVKTKNGKHPKPWFVEEQEEDDSEPIIQETRPWYVEDEAEDNDNTVVVVDSTPSSSSTPSSFFWGGKQQQQQARSSIKNNKTKNTILERRHDEATELLQEAELVDRPRETTTILTPSQMIQEVEILEAMISPMEEDRVIGNQQVDLVDDAMRQVMAEIVTDDDFEIAMGKAKTLKGANNKRGASSTTSSEEEGEEDDDDGEPNAVAMLALRALDIVLLAGEKAAVAVPAVIRRGGTVVKRVSNVKSDGLGSEGWEIILSAQRGEKKY